MENRYEMIRTLGSGATGNILLMYDHFIQRYVALKELNGSTQDWINQSLQREFHILAMLEHEKIPRILDCVHLKEKKFMVMEYIDGINLQELVTFKGALTEEQVIDIGIQLCEILRYLHTRSNKILYLDLKPQNIMLDTSGKIKLIDFGSAREVRAESALEKKEEMRAGTYGYAPPELLVQGSVEVDERTDIYSLGATLFYLLTEIDPAKPPYKISRVREWNSIVSFKMDKIIKTCTEQELEQRYQNVNAVLAKLKEDKNIIGKKGIAEYVKYCIKIRKRFFMKQEKNIFCSEKKVVGLLGIIACTCCLLSLTAMESYAAREKLLVNIRNEINQKLLIQEGSIYYTRESILFEIPKQQMEQEEEYEFTIISKNLSSGQEKERKILIVSQSEEENRTCIENTPK